MFMSKKYRAEKIGGGFWRIWKYSNRERAYIHAGAVCLYGHRPTVGRIDCILSSIDEQVA
jgi:hypothetical protein